MATQTLSIDNYQDGQQQMQVVTELKTEQDPNCLEADEGGLSPSPVESQTPMDADKQAIYRHPLFPLLALLFEKCEQSTQGSEGTTSASFDVDIENFVRKQEKEGKPFFCEDTETDNLMVKAIQVLRIHLLELEKVNELCKDFCSRYIACLKTKMNSETLLSGESGSPYSPVQPQSSNFKHDKDSLDLLEQLSSWKESPENPLQSAITGTLSPQGIMVPASALQQGNVTMATVAGGTVYQPVTVVTPQGQVVTQALSPGTIRIQNSQVNNWFINARRLRFSSLCWIPVVLKLKNKEESSSKPTSSKVLARLLCIRNSSASTQMNLQCRMEPVVTITSPVNMNVDSLSLFHQMVLLVAVQQVMMAGQSEGESVDSTER
uniref:Homeobox protein pknox1 n=1 Tax=Sphaerodactylus townsendi TaxID=933632 RepID=A0ACB8FIM4_9SAUR